MQDIINMIVNVGFPIVATVCLGYYVKQLHNNYRQDIKEMSDKHEKEVDGLTQAINELNFQIEKSFDVEIKE